MIHSLYEQMLAHQRSGAEALDLRIIIYEEDTLGELPEELRSIEILVTVNKTNPLVVRLAS